MQDVCVRHTHLEQEPEYVPVEFAALQTYMVVLPQLVVFVHPSHVHIVKFQCFGARDVGSAVVGAAQMSVAEAERWSTEE